MTAEDDAVGSVRVTTAQMYALLQTIDAKLTSLTGEVSVGSTAIRDHEARIREIEQRGDLSRRVAEIEATMKSVQQRLWAFPSIAGLAAIIAIVVALSDRL